MDEVPGIPGSIPILAPYPPQIVASKLPPEEWQACLDTWIFCIEFRLRLSPNHFRHLKLSQSASGVPFLQAYLHSQTDKHEPSAKRSGREEKLYRSAYFLLQRLLLETEGPYDCEPAVLFALLGRSSMLFAMMSKWRDVLQLAWKKASTPIKLAVEYAKTALLRELPNANADAQHLHPLLQQANALVKSLPATGEIFMTGSDYIEALTQAYSERSSGRRDDGLKDRLTEHAFYCLRSLTLDPTPKLSLLLDHLYLLKSSTDKISKSRPEETTLLSNLVCATTFLRHLDIALDIALAASHQTRGKQLLSSLRDLREQKKHLHTDVHTKRPKSRKGKGRALVNDEMHMHDAARVSQIHELFPDLSNNYILKLLDHFSDDVEAVTAALLEPDMLPKDLQDQSNYSDDMPPPELNYPAPPSSPPPAVQKKSIYDGDAFDRLQISASKVHRGRRDITSAAPATADEHTRNKAAIMAALAAFDSDDDERDDTYDVADVGGTVDSTIDTDARSARPAQSTTTAQGDPNEETLYKAYKSSRDLFARDSKTRLSAARASLKRETGLSDEQIEGWAVMLGRDAKLESRLERRYASVAAFGGRNQRHLAPSRWNAGGSRSGTGTEEEESDFDASDAGGANRGTGGDGRRTGGEGVRGARSFGRGGGGRGGNVAGRSNEAATQAARRRKEQGRGRGGANHNRREGRAKKMGRGMAGAGAG